jgi:hypothetical protein
VFGPQMPRELDQDERAALVWLSGVDGFKMAKVLTRETLLVVYANLVAAGQYKERSSDVAGTVPEVRDVRPDPEG